MDRREIQEKNFKQSDSEDDNHADDKSLLLQEGNSFSDLKQALKSDQKSLTLTIDQMVDKLDVGLFHFLIVLFCGLACSGYTIVTVAYNYIIVVACDLDIETYNKGLLNILLMIGVLVGSGIIGRLGDAVGRRTCILISVSLSIITLIASAFTYNYTMLVVLGFFNGFGCGGTFTIAHAYCIEFFPQRYRGNGLACMTTFSCLGGLYTSAIALVVLPYPLSIPIGVIHFNSWRLYLILSSIPLILSFCFLLFMPNSLRFMVIKGDQNRISQVLNTINRVNSWCCKRNDSSLTTTDLTKYTIIVSSDQGELKTNKNENRDFFSHYKKFNKSPWRRRLIFLLILWFGSCFSTEGLWVWMPTVITYYTTGKTCKMVHNSSLNNSYQYYPNSSISNCISGPKLTSIVLDVFYGNLVALPIGIAFTILINRIGRKWCCCFVITMSGLIALLIMWIDTVLSTFILAGLYYAIANNLWLGIKIWTAELFPTDLRATTLGLTALLGCLGTVCSLAIFTVLFHVNCIANLLLVAAVVQKINKMSQFEDLT
ncbi:uncharacterized protein TRIADDRAFT_60673 [Trichoplax adhaerens]|uniref:Major facilitator superfamily (MFS) profile domain-containing protein n=1 Tax=Trichoplax adhaerens TaxID=10228 RepID=B3S926_TRIAD|nr:hypothetical protein TRIADDRAFT_60673 [Trichoplax adhaerens]EDV20725.1 hypothetical protein TRIADDRAFT_60673 [Trichoplax adhaerens]|eukprot:XP_002116666.1 hypothetical protein TRIADDRAFT_60673 [Trichoplax adhaerens]